MKLHPLAQGHLQGPVVDPAPAGRETWDGFPPLFEIHEVLEDVEHHGDKVKATTIDNPQFPPRCGDLFPQASVASPEGDEHQDNATDDELFHGISLSARVKSPGQPRRSQHSRGERSGYGC